MSDTNETIADIIAWLRKPMEGENAYLTAWRDEIADRLEAAHRRELAAGGNAARLREALDEIRVAAMSDYEPDADYLIEKCNAALAAPPRNCEVGTPEEQAQRFGEYCHAEVCKRKKCKTRPKALFIDACALEWAQMPYEAEEGGAE